MDVELYVYDLSKGLARMYSLPLTGTQMDAIYHTSIVLNGVEYYFGQGIQTSFPGSTHHGQPMEVVNLGKTELPTDVVEEYIQSLGEIYTPESYDLFLHNCNNFTQDLAMFLVGKSIPDNIRNLPRTFLETPFGQMMKPQIEMALRGVTQGTGQVPPPAAAAAPAAPVPHTAVQPAGKVRIVSSLSQLDTELASASKSCAVIFFTSSTCPPCKAVYPTYDELAEEAGGKAVLIKVDIGTAYDVSMRYQVRGTPTFMSFLRGEKLDEWSGANPAQLRGNVRMLVEMAHPTHPHRQLRVPSLQRAITNYVMYKKIPPMDKLVQKLTPYHEDPTLLSMLVFIKHFSSSRTPADTPLTHDLPSFVTYLETTLPKLPSASHFALLDLVRILFLDPRISSYFAENEPAQKALLTILSPTTTTTTNNNNSNLSSNAESYPLRIVKLQLACNLFSSPLSIHHLTSHTSPALALRNTVVQLTISCLLDTHPNLRVVAASFAYNLLATNHNARFSDNPDLLTEEEQVELTASLIEAIAQETESSEALHGLLFALGLVAYEAPMDGAVMDLCRVMGVGEVVTGKGKDNEAFKKEDALIREITLLMSPS